MSKDKRYRGKTTPGLKMCMDNIKGASYKKETATVDDKPPHLKRYDVKTNKAR
tara:strand:+ start:360 stop:518 length:159 start_codon:yes stop_codon:yes gene_type:complete